MSFIESPTFPPEVGAWLVGGEEFLTEIVINRAGYEQRNQVWSNPLRKYSVQNGLREIKNVLATKAFFRAVGGRTNGFRVKDTFDYTVATTEGVLGTTGLGTGYPTYQLFKNYVSGAVTSQGKVTKPVVGTVAVQRNAVIVTAGNAAGNYALDTTTGIVSFVADAQSTVANITVGATTLIRFTGNIAGLTSNVGSNLLYIAGMTGANAATLNGLAHTITNVSGANITISTNTANMTINISGSGYKYPQAADVLTWSGEYDIPVRFDADWLQIGLDPGGLLNWNSVTLQELRL